MKFWEIAGIKYRTGQTGYKRLIFCWLYDWHEEWGERENEYWTDRLNELKESS